MVFIFNNTLLYCIIVNEFSSQFFSLSAAYQKKSHDAQKRLSALDSVYIFARFRSLYCNGLFWALWTLRPLPTRFYFQFLSYRLTECQEEKPLEFEDIVDKKTYDKMRPPKPGGMSFNYVNLYVSRHQFSSSFLQYITCSHCLKNTQNVAFDFF